MPQLITSPTSAINPWQLKMKSYLIVPFSGNEERELFV